LTFLRCIALLYFAIRLESRKSANKRIYLSIYVTVNLCPSLVSGVPPLLFLGPHPCQWRGGGGGCPCRVTGDVCITLIGHRSASPLSRGQSILLPVARFPALRMPLGGQVPLSRCTCSDKPRSDRRLVRYVGLNWLSECPSLTLHLTGVDSGDLRVPNMQYSDTRVAR